MTWSELQDQIDRVTREWEETVVNEGYPDSHEFVDELHCAGCARVFEAQEDIEALAVAVGVLEEPF